MLDVRGLPRTYWILWTGALINRLGGFVMPLLARTLAATIALTLSSLSIGCEVILQPSQQGEWSDGNWRNPKYKITKDIRDAGEPEKPPADQSGK